MDPSQAFHPLGFGLVMVGLLLELALLWWRPRWLAKLAFYPVDENTVALDRRYAPALYRDTPGRPWPLSSLGLDGLRYEDDTAVAAFEGGQGWMRLRYRFWGFNRTMGVLRVEASVDGDLLRLRAKIIPSPLVSLLPMLFLMPSAPGVFVLLPVILFAGGVGLAMAVVRARPSLSLFFRDLASRAQSPRPR